MKHLSTCSDCLKARSSYLHKPIPVDNCTFLQCGVCQCYIEACGERRLIYHCGSVEIISRRTGHCECAHLDRLGNSLKIDDRCLIIPLGQPFARELSEGEKFLMQLKDVRLDGLYCSGSVVEVCGKDGRLAAEPDTWEYISISHIISARAFRSVGVLASNFLTHTWRKLLDLRKRQPIIGSLHWIEIKSLSWVNTSTHRIIVLEAGDSIALAKQLR